jgi:DNA-directed RNA polymerase specialized sigma24 family protein
VEEYAKGWKNLTVVLLAGGFLGAVRFRDGQRTHETRRFAAGRLATITAMLTSDELVALLEKYGSRIRAACRRYMRGDESWKDLYQDTCIRLQRAFDPRKKGGWSYIQKTIRSVYIDHVRKLRRLVPHGRSSVIERAVAPGRNQAGRRAEDFDSLALLLERAKNFVSEGFGRRLFKWIQPKHVTAVDLHITEGYPDYKSAKYYRAVFKDFAYLVRIHSLCHGDALELMYKSCRTFLDTNGWNSLRPLEKTCYVLSFVGLKSGEIYRIVGSTLSNIYKTVSVANKKMQ